MILKKLQKNLDDSNFWDEFETDWVCLDVEIMPWSAKAQGLLKNQYSSVGCAGRESLKIAVETLSKACESNVNDNGIDLSEVTEMYKIREQSLKLYTEAYRGYCWDINTIDDYKIAPFHILATEGKMWNNLDHVYHMETIKKYMSNDKIFITTNYKVIELNNIDSVNDGVNWWLQLTENGGEGMVVKPYDFTVYKDMELLQPAVKCRGSEYLRIIYGPEYTLKNNITRLKRRSLHKKRHLAICEFALGIESLQRFVNKEPLYKFHECVFGVLALESESVDPRL